MSTKGTVSPSPTSKSATVVRSSPRVSTGVRSTVMSCPQIASSAEPSSLFLTQGISVPKPKRITSCIRILTRPLNAAHQPHDVGRVAARRHEIDQVDDAVGGFEPRLQDQRVVPIAARGAGDFARRRDQPAAMLVGAEQGGKAGVGIEGRPAQPVDRAVAADQRRGLAIADQPVVFDSAGQRVCHHLGSMLRRATARGSRLQRRRRRSSTAISSSGTGSRRRQFGCSSTVPGMLGWSTSPSRSSSAIASSRDLVRARKFATE